MATPVAYPTISQTDFPGLKLLARGKVRDIYELGDRLLIVATDRLSAFDVILPTPIPDKGRVLTQLSLFWFDKLAGLVPHHVINATDFSGPLAPYQDALNGRAMIVRRTNPIPIECVARGYISGSGWKDYRATGKVCGIPLPAGLKESDKLPEPIFTPATKATSGHDENISFDEAAAQIGQPASRAPARYHSGSVSSRLGVRRRARHHHRRHEIRIRPRWRRTHLDRRSLDSGFFALLARRFLRARKSTAVF